MEVRDFYLINASRLGAQERIFLLDWLAQLPNAAVTEFLLTRDISARLTPTQNTEMLNRFPLVSSTKDSAGELE